MRGKRGREADIARSRLLERNSYGGLARETKGGFYFDIIFEHSVTKGKPPKETTEKNIAPYRE